ncbi:hypothetical protein ZWY2020_021884 [Hordeum vulgare]|nr:hypothetical protein ZWY2020_021884 [Hordeum vulgare]
MEHHMFLLRRPIVLLTLRAERHTVSLMSVGRVLDVELHTSSHLQRVTSHDPEDFLVHFELSAYRDNVVHVGSINIDGVIFDIKPWHEDDHVV